MPAQIIDSWFFHPATATYEDAVAKFSQLSAPQVLSMPPAHGLRVLDVHIDLRRKPPLSRGGGMRYAASAAA